jgi:DNA-binding response OmpR family regulator
MSTILIVDALEGDASVLASALRVEGYNVALAASANDARAVMQREPVALAVVDLMLRAEGGPHGLELARELRQLRPTARIVLTSAYHLSERQLERADCGVSGFIPKPYDLNEVLDFIRAKVNAPPSSRRIQLAEQTTPPTSGVARVFEEEGDVKAPASPRSRR